MDFSDFIEHVTDNIKAYLPPEYDNADIQNIEVLKPNGILLNGITVKKSADDTIGATIYLNNMYSTLKDGRDLKEIMAQIAEIIQNSSEYPFNLDDVRDLSDFEKVKDKVNIRLINLNDNTDYLKDRPYKEIADLAMIYYIDLSATNGTHSTVCITDKLLASYGISLDALHETAIKNMSGKLRFNSMRSVLEEMSPAAMKDMDGQCDIPMYILTNAEKINGASCIACDRFLQEVRIMLNRDYYILPSSRHELIAIPMSDDIDPKQLKHTVWEVNDSCVDPEDRLSDSVYLYKWDTQSIEIAA